jgi:uncharacterized protein YjbI with pentapeptide repeats
MSKQEIYKITQSDLDLILEKHKLWLEHKEGGIQADLRNQDLLGLDFHNKDLRFVVIWNSNLRGSVFHGSDLSYSIIINSDLRESNFSNVKGNGTCFRFSDLRSADFNNANLSKVDFNNSDLRGSEFIGANLYNVTFRYANLYGTCFQNSNLSGADLYKSDLRGADFSAANLNHTNLTDAKLMVLTLPQWSVYIHTDTVRIGPWYYKHDTWLNFSDRDLRKMSKSLLVWWMEYKPLIASGIKIIKNQVNENHLEDEF